MDMEFEFFTEPLVLTDEQSNETAMLLEELFNSVEILEKLRMVRYPKYCLSPLDANIR
jgi:hypothetical protein